MDLPYRRLVDDDARSLDLLLTVSFGAIIMLYWGILMYYAITFRLPRPQLGIGFLGLSMVVYAFMELQESAKKERYLDSALLIGVILTTLACTYYFWTNYQELNFVRLGFATDMDYRFAATMVAAVLYLTYRSFGWPFIMVTFAALGYTYFGPYMPGLFHHTGMGYERILMIAVTEIEGIYGSLTRLGATWIALFMLLAGLLQAYGAFSLLFKASVRISSYFKSGVALAAVFASMIVASVNGSAVANSALTGSITIPLMKEHGLQAKTAAGIEAAASNGGQVLPPIMGASAFLMASLLNIHYGSVLIAAVVPGIIYFASIAVAVHFAAVRDIDEDFEVDLDELEDEVPKELKLPLLLDVVRFVVPIFVLLYLLVYLQYTIMTSALWSVYAMLITGILFPFAYHGLVNRRVLDPLAEAAKNTWTGFILGAKLLAPIGIVIATLNLIADLLLATGVPGKLTLALMDLAGGIMILAILFSVIICIVLGLGMPTIAAYLIVAILVAPAIIANFGVPELAGHFFVLYAANLATITPPIAGAVVIATGIAGSNFWASSLVAVRVSAPVFVLPFMIVYNPEIATASIGTQTILTGAIGLVGAIILTFGLNYPLPDLDRVRSLGLRTATSVSGIVIMAYPGTGLKVALLAVTLVGIVLFNRSQVVEPSPAD